MTPDSLTPFARLPIFEGLSTQQLSHIAHSAERIVYQPGDLIQSDGGIPDAAILIVSGKAVIVDDRRSLWQVHGQQITPGSLVSELSMLIEAQCISTVIARSAVRAFRITRDGMRMLMHADPSIAAHFVDKIADRLSDMAAEMRRIEAMVANQTASAIPPSKSTGGQMAQVNLH